MKLFGSMLSLLIATFLFSCGHNEPETTESSQLNYPNFQAFGKRRGDVRYFHASRPNPMPNPLYLWLTQLYFMQIQHSFGQLGSSYYHQFPSGYFPPQVYRGPDYPQNPLPPGAMPPSTPPSYPPPSQVQQVQNYAIVGGTVPVSCVDQRQPLFQGNNANFDWIGSPVSIQVGGSGASLHFQGQMNLSPRTAASLLVQIRGSSGEVLRQTTLFSMGSTAIAANSQRFSNVVYVTGTSGTLTLRFAISRITADDTACANNQFGAGTRQVSVDGLTLNVVSLGY